MHTREGKTMSTMKEYIDTHPELKKASSEVQEKRYKHYDQRRLRSINEAKEMRAFDVVILKSKMQELLLESRKNMDEKMKKINRVIHSMKEENDNIISKSK